MLKDITLGQYFPGDSPVHRLDPRLKIVLVLAYIILLFIVDGPVSYGVLAVFLVLVVGLSRVSIRLILRGVKPILFIIVFTSLLNMFYTRGRVLWEWGTLHLTVEGIRAAVIMVVRLVFLIVGTSMLTYTTSPIVLTDGLERLLSPLKRLHFPAHELAMMMTIALRFMPTLVEETNKIMKAQKARGADFESGNLIQRARALIPILIPLFVSAFRRADELAVAMECRLYRGDVGRTRMRELKITRSDVGTTLVCLAFFAGALVVKGTVGL